MTRPAQGQHFVRQGASLLLPVIVLGAVLFIGQPGQPDEKPAVKEAAAKSSSNSHVSGKELFLREWISGDPRSHGGDGLGPVFNDSSCVACHNQGGPGGGGAASKNVDIISAFLNESSDTETAEDVSTFIIQELRAFLGFQDAPKVSEAETAIRKKKRQEALLKIHPGFRTARSVVLHQFGTDAKYSGWRQKTLDGSQDEVSRIGIDFDVRDNPQGPLSAPVPVPAPVERIERFDLVRRSTFPRFAVSDLDVPVVQTQPNVRMNPLWEAVESLLDSVFGAELEVVSDVVFLLSDAFHVEEGVEPDETMRLRMEAGFGGQTTFHGEFLLTTSQRNPTALFGAGLIDSVPDKVLESAAAQKFSKFPEVTGRVARLADGRIGRFGWKSQKATLHDFTMTACAVELGLHVPEHSQSSLPYQADKPPQGFDLNEAECRALVDYLKKLPAPVERRPSQPAVGDYIAQGQKLFDTVGCAACHVQNLGDVAGIYSDLLLHDMGPEMGDNGQYGGFIPDSPGDKPDTEFPALATVSDADVIGTLGIAFQFRAIEVGKVPEKMIGATTLEWRTPPLWGLRDSAPYLHDGRAKSIEHAIAFHGGEASRSTQLFFKLSSAERQQLVAFLKTLVAPEQTID